MHLPNHSKPSVRDTRRRPWRGMDPKQLGILPLDGEDEYEGAESDESDESVGSGDSGDSGD
jgi:hypothetical protein